MKKPLHIRLFGHEVKTLVTDGVIVEQWADDGTTIDNPRPCARCKKFPTKDGHDPCLVNLPGVVGACCGHGVTEGYIRFEDDTYIRGWFTVEDRIITEKKGIKQLLGFKCRW